MNRDTLLEFFWYSDGMRPAGSSEPADANGTYLKVSDVEALLDAQAVELAFVREVLNTDLKAAQERVLTLELENQQLQRRATTLENESKWLSEEKHRQLEMLATIRTEADAATGIDRTKGDERLPGALGAVRHLIAQFTAMKDAKKTEEDNRIAYERSVYLLDRKEE